MTPLELSICLHYHSSAEDMPWVLRNAPIRDDVIKGLIQTGLLTDDWAGIPGDAPKPSQRFRPTPMLHAFVAMLKKTPLPELWWVDLRTGERIMGHGL